MIDSATGHFDRFEFSRALEAIWTLVAAADKFIVEQAPWKLARAQDGDGADGAHGAREKLDIALGTAAETVRVAAALLAPVMPESAAKIWSELGMTSDLDAMLFADLQWGQYPAGQSIGDIAAVFPRIDAQPATEQMRVLEHQAGLQQAALLGQPAASEPPSGITPIAASIAIDDFAKVDLRVGQVVSAEPVKGADKLLHLKVDIGEPELRNIVAGIAQVYQPDQVVGRRVVIVANLEPRKLRGVLSQGMIVAASLDGGKPVLAGFLEDVPIGARLK